MKQNQQDAPAEASINNPPSSEPDNVGFDQFSISRIQEPVEIPQEAPPEEVVEEVPDEPEPEPEPSEEPAEQEGIAEPEEDTTAIDAEDVLSQFENLSPEEIKKVSKEISSRSVARFGQMTAQKRALEQQLQAAQAKLTEMEAGNPFEQPDVVENNPYSDLNSFDDLQAKAKTLEQIDEWADKLLWKHNSADPDDVITTEDGQDLTKEQVRDYQVNARKGVKKFLPARLKEIQNAEFAKAEGAQLQEVVKKQISWMGDEENQTYGAYQKTVADPIIEKIKEAVPEVAHRLDYILAHAVNSLAGAQAKPAPKKPAAKKPGTVPRPAPPSNPAGNAARSPDRPDQKVSKHLKELSSRYDETGAIADFERLRAEQIANRNKR